MLVSLGSAMRWSRRVRLKSPGTEKTSVTPTWTRRRARWRPRVASVEVMAVAGREFLMAEAVPLGTLPTSLLAGLVESREPMLSMGLFEFDEVKVVCVDGVREKEEGVGIYKVV
ncbi:hypothetical protein V8G54_009107 [Vigna mungo]|uniref:Uncharacterized protein n=1 Tax=Vigna mungo TaxID=3915 RepID=A0AAQ3NTV0_VIGMU